MENWELGARGGEHQSVSRLEMLRQRDDEAEASLGYILRQS